MSETARGASVTLMVLLVVEGLGGLLVTLLNVVTSRALGQEFMPWESSVIPAAFGVLSLAAAVGVGRSATWGTILAAISQFLVLAAGVVALLNQTGPLAWVVVAIGLLGLLLLPRTGKRT